MILHRDLKPDNRVLATTLLRRCVVCLRCANGHAAVGPFDEISQDLAWFDLSDAALLWQARQATLSPQS